MSYLGLDPDEMQDMFNNFIRDYKSIQQFVKDYNKQVYEQWKAGGFLVEDDLSEMYPSIKRAFRKALENFQEELDKEDQDDTIEESNLLHGSGE